MCLFQNARVARVARARCEWPLLRVTGLGHFIDWTWGIMRDSLDYCTTGYKLGRGCTLGYSVFTSEQDNDKTTVEPVHSYDAFHTRSDKPGVKGIIGMHRFNFCLVVVLLSCSCCLALVLKWHH